MLLDRPEYMRMCLDIMPDEIVDKYNLHQLADSEGWVYIKIMKGMYGLPQARLLVNKLLEQQLTARGFYQCQFTLGFWCHVW